ncbi:tetratricopeptide repeat protein [Azospirillum doebereinerae]|uniref:tetratricopeptide repeat protein n=1 Tax=Azospirillum doebereinerae TaxID=92933 RepID=UPI001EE63505|nr:tetratricopeptide repeat protein [Azospirillum doebereinerae]MCG5240402.1 tetratricopeptide repeat protein [Azospirillum doebereinerae]
MASLHEALNAALDHMEAGRLAEADTLCGRILDAVPEHPDTLHVWGVCAARMGLFPEAAGRVRRAIAGRGDASHYRVTLANILVEMEQGDEAVSAYRTAARLDPAAGTLYALGRLLERQGKGAVVVYRAAVCADPAHFDAYCRLGEALGGAEAVSAYRCALALDSWNADLHHNLGLALQDAGRQDEALAALRTATKLRSDFPEAQYSLGNLLQARGGQGEAVAAYRAALSQRPDFAEAWCNLGNAWKGQRVFEKARSAQRIAVALRPDLDAAWSNLGFALHALGRPDAAVEAHRIALRLAPALAGARSNLGLALKDLGRVEEAVAAQHGAVALAPALSEAWSNLGSALKASGRVNEALTAHGRAVLLTPDSADARLNRSHLLLATGDFAVGWAEYEWRWRSSMQRDRGFPWPQWRGEALNGRRILLHAEQGFGDTLQFVRYAAMVAEKGGAVVLEIQAPLKRLLGRLPGAVQVIARGEPLPDCDLHCPLLSLPLAFGTRLDSVPAAVPYLQADPALCAAWAERFPSDGRLEVGLVWAGSPQPGHRRVESIDRQRSMALAQLAPLAGIPGMRFHSLQKDGEAAAQAATPPDGMELVDAMGSVGDFADTAALVERLDLVIGVDTAVVHLAGALGKPVWVLSRYDGCWRWLENRSDSLWYPSLRLYRQDWPGCWEPVVGRVAADLRALAAGR